MNRNLVRRARLGSAQTSHNDRTTWLSFELRAPQSYVCYKS